MLLKETNEDMVVAALLHDTLEDTATTEKELRSLFGPDVAELVVELTERSLVLGLKQKGVNRAARIKANHEFLRNVSRSSKRIKLCDRLDNISDLDPSDGFSRKYARETISLLDAIGDANPQMASEILIKVEQLL
jgi:(p)ppGpp synthase/HD superfamily hydrolase